jgi:abortive infection bacteriophage resistance protein
VDIVVNPFSTNGKTLHDKEKFFFRNMNTNKKVVSTLVLVTKNFQWPMVTHDVSCTMCTHDYHIWLNIVVNPPPTNVKTLHDKEKFFFRNMNTNKKVPSTLVLVTKNFQWPMVTHDVSRTVCTHDYHIWLNIVVNPPPTNVKTLPMTKKIFFSKVWIQTKKLVPQ